MTTFHSKLLNEIANVTEDGSVTFDSGVTYSPDEIVVLKNLSPEDIKGIHKVKQFFEGELTFCGKASAGFTLPLSFLVKEQQKVKTLKDETILIEGSDTEQLSLF